MTKGQKDAYRNYLRSLVSQETSSDDSDDLSTQLSRKRTKSSQPDKTDENERKRKYARSENTYTGVGEDPQEGTSRGPILRRETPHSLENDPDKRAKVGDQFQKGTVVFSDKNVDIHVQSIGNNRNTRFRTEDHLYQITINPHRRTAPLILSLEKALREALTLILLKLKGMYAANLHHQIYLTIIEQNILHGLNTGNYDINSPANIIVNRAMTILHSYLKSKQTLRLNNSFKIQLKVLSHRHTHHLVTTKPQFQKHVFRNFSRFRN